MRAVFFGTPEFAVPCLDALVGVAEVALVVCQPDKPVGRGLVMTAPPVKARALALGLRVEQPAKVRTGELAALVREQHADVAVVIAYGRILGEDVLGAPRAGCVNVHASLLPRYRGAAPIAWAIARGEAKTGVTLMKMDAGMDTGPTLACAELAIGPEETAAELATRLSSLGARFLADNLARIVSGELRPVEQDHAHATLAPLLTKEHGLIDWNDDAACVHDQVRAMSPWPLASSTHKGKRVIVHETRIVGDAPAGAEPGRVVVADKSRVLVACGARVREGYVGATSKAVRVVDLTRVQLEGKKAVRGADWFLGRGVAPGDLLGV